MRTVRVLLLVPLVLSVFSCASTPKARTPANEPTPIAQDKILSFDKFIEILKNESATDIAGMIKILSERFPEHLHFRTAMYDSGSLQGASYTEPRVIVFGPNADFIFTFNGNPSQRGGSSLEFMRYNYSRKEFEFFEAGFKKEMKEPKLDYLLDDEVGFENERVIVTKANPVKCMECHGFAKTGPIWHNHFFWPGTFGSNDDLLYGSFRKGGQHNHGGYTYLSSLKWPRSQGRALDLPQGAKDKELTGYIEYLKSAPTHPRFKHLPAQIFEAGFRKYIAGIPVDQIDDTEAIRTFGQSIGMIEPDRQNGYLGERLLRLSLSQLVGRITRQPALYARVKEVLSKPIIDYPFTWGPGHIQFFQVDTEALKTKFSWLATMEERRGAFKFHLQKIIQEEFELQVDKTERHEKLMGAKLTVLPEWTAQLGEDSTPAIAQYGKLLGHSLSRSEILSMEWEAGSIPDLALLDYVLMDAGIDLSDYDINLTTNVKRKLSLHSSSVYYLKELMGIGGSGTAVPY